jgi:hypothetical protein
MDVLAKKMSHTQVDKPQDMHAVVWKATSKYCGVTEKEAEESVEADKWVEFEQLIEFIVV